jgi:non-specific serine/threonine protein kinase
VEVARRVTVRFEDGVRLVELAQIDDPSLVAAAVAEAFGVRQSPGMSLTESLAAVVGGRHAFVVLDNCEHVVDAAADLCTHLLTAGRDLHVLATSREPLRVEGEARFPLAPLAVPETGDAADAVAACAAVALFVERAQQVNPTFNLSETSTEAVSKIVRRLDGMPLAIELAAAQLDVLGLGQLVADLSDGFRDLANPARAASARQASLHATVEWSYRLLDDEERRALRRLAVFPAPFTLSAGAVVVDGPPELVTKLVRRSLLNAPREGVDGRSRYVMLEMVRAYAGKRLEECGERDKAEAAMAAYMLHEAERVATSFDEPDDHIAGSWGDAEQDNLRAGMEWLLGHDPPAALRLAIALSPWALLRGHYREGRTALEKAQSAVTGEVESMVEVWLGRLAHNSSRFGVALAHFERAEASEGPGAQSRVLVDALVGQTWELYNLGQNPRAREKAQEALSAARAIGYGSGEMHALTSLSMAALYAGDYIAALAWARQSAGVDRDRSSGHAIRFSLTVSVLAEGATGDLGAAERLAIENLELCRRAGDQAQATMQLETLARIEIRTRRWGPAAEHLSEATRISAEIGEPLKLADCLATAAVWAAERNPEQAAMLWGAGRAISDLIRPYRVPLMDIVDTSDEDSADDSAFYTPPMLDVRSRLGPDAAHRAETRGLAMGLDEVLALIDEVLTDARSVSSTEAAPTLNLTKRERQLVALVAEGLTDAEIAEKLFISVRTVRTHLDRIKGKTGVRRRAELTRLALQQGLA